MFRVILVKNLTFLLKVLWTSSSLKTPLMLYLIWIMNYTHWVEHNI